jgi:hypothetical protein
MRHKHSAIELEDLLVLNQEKKVEQDSLKLKLETDRLYFEKEIAATHERNVEKRLELLPNQADLQRQQQNDNTRMQLKMLEEMEDVTPGRPLAINYQNITYF